MHSVCSLACNAASNSLAAVTAEHHHVSQDGGSRCAASKRQSESTAQSALLDGVQGCGDRRDGLERGHAPAHIALVEGSGVGRSVKDTSGLEQVLGGANNPRLRLVQVGLQKDVHQV